MRWMLDTDTCIAIIKRKPESALKKLRGKQIGQVGISSVTLAELSFGASKSTKPKESHDALKQFLLALDVAEFGFDAAMHYGDVRAALSKTGAPIGPLGTLIASHAYSLDAILVTHNTAEFSRIRSLRLEDWVTDE
jgi:tRNA(fMet)-specific endonuclease VapC